MPAPAVPQRHVRQRFARVMRFAASLSILFALVAVLLVARGEATLHITRLITAALGIGLAVLIGTALMLLFPGTRGGHDADPGAAPSESDQV